MEPLTTGVLLLAFMAAQGEILKPLQMPCPMLYCPQLENCIKIKTTYLNINGRQCIGCPKCADESGEGKRQIGTPIDLTKFRMCPIVDCAFPGFCAISKPSYFQINGMNCTGCPVCSNQILGKRSVIPIDLGHLIQCPLVDCAFKAGCTAITHSTFQWNGRQCQGCPICEEKLSPREVLPGNVLHLNICPMVLCAAPGPCDQPYKLSTTMWQGKECPGCSYCPSKTDKTREVIEVKPMCPMAKCRAPGPCDRPYSMSYIEIGGMKCPMCPFCERNQLKPQREVLNPGLIHLEICPIPMCVAPGPCDHPYSMSYVTVGDKKCPMCAYCKKDTKREVITSPRTCPLLPCLPLIDCAQTQSTTYQFEGRSCPGCPVCTQPKQ